MVVSRDDERRGPVLHCALDFEQTLQATITLALVYSKAKPKALPWALARSLLHYAAQLNHGSK